MGFVLSWKFAIFRIFAGLILVLGISTLANRVANEAIVATAVLDDELSSVEDNNLFILRTLPEIDVLPFQNREL